MRKMFVASCLCFVSLAIVGAQQAYSKSPEKKSGAEIAQIEQLERDWAKAMVSDPAASVDRYEAEDIVSTDPTGRVTDKAQDKKEMGSGDLKFQSMDLAEVRCRVFGNTAVATGLTNLKGTFKGQDISGAYRFTDTWAKRDGKWQVVATQATKVQPQ
jgi:ketosteroid isomerase-like protein